MFIQDDSSSSEEEDESSPADIKEYTPGKFVLYKHAPKRVYVTTIYEVASKVTLKAARKYGERNGKITFCWPRFDLFFDVDQLGDEQLTALPDPVIDRRRSSVIFKRGVFGKVPLGNLM